MSGHPSGRVFISYRRQQSSGIAGRLYDRLAARFGDDQVFMDVDTIALGVDFAEVITQAVSTCEVLLAVIGPHWLSVTDEEGQRRLDDPDDIVRLELQAALERGIRVIPILVGGAVMPRRHDLPEDLASLARRNALSVRHESFRVDADRLLAAIEPILHTDMTVGPGSSVMPLGRAPQIKTEPGATTPTRLEEQQFLRSLDNDEYRQALRGLFDVAKAVGLVFEWGSMGGSIRLSTPDREEPLTVAWVFPDRAGWSGLRHLTLGYDRGSAANTPSIRDALAEYVNAVRLVPGAMPAKARALHAYTFPPEAVCAQHEQLERLLRGLSTRAREGRVRRDSIPQRLVDHQVFREGQSLRIVVPAGVGEDREAIGAWLEQEPTRPAVTWRQDPHQPVVWAGDGRPYNLSSLIRYIVEQATGRPPQTQVWGPNWYRDDSDRTLAKLAEQLP